MLRHLLVRQRLVDVQECLFVPLLMSWFTRDKTLRWRNTLAPSTPRSLRGGYDALDRIDAGYVGSDLPLGRYADENLETVEGDLNIRFQLTRPRDKDEDFDAAAWSPLLKLFGFDPADFYAQHLKDQKFKDRVFLDQIGPQIASNLDPGLRVSAVRADDSEVEPEDRPHPGLDRSPTTGPFGLAADDLQPARRCSRAEIKAVRISAQARAARPPFVIDVLPAGSRGDRRDRVVALPDRAPVRRAVQRRVHPQRPDRHRRRTHRDAAEPRRSCATRARRTRSWPATCSTTSTRTSSATTTALGQA